MMRRFMAFGLALAGMMIPLTAHGQAEEEASAESWRDRLADADFEVQPYGTAVLNIVHNSGKPAPTAEAPVAAVLGSGYDDEIPGQGSLTLSARQSRRAPRRGFLGRARPRRVDDRVRPLGPQRVQRTRHDHADDDPPAPRVLPGSGTSACACSRASTGPW